MRNSIQKFQRVEIGCPRKKVQVSEQSVRLKRITGIGIVYNLHLYITKQLQIF